LAAEQKTAARKLALDQENDARHAKLDVEQTEAAFALADKENSRIRKNAGTTPEEMQAADQKQEEALLARNAARTAAQRLPEQSKQQTADQQKEFDEQNKILAADHARKLEEQQHQTADAQIRATTTGEAQRIAIREANFKYEEQVAGDHSQAMVGFVQAEHEAIRAEDRRANAEKIESALARTVPAAAVAEWHREKANYGAMGADKEQVAELERQKLTANYELQTKDALLQKAVTTNRLTERQADYARMALANPLAQAPGEEGDKVRAAMKDLVNAKHYDTGMGHFFSDGVQRWEHDQAAILKGGGGDDKTIGDLIAFLETKGILLKTQ
jgi:hypothetical protein